MSRSAEIVISTSRPQSDPPESLRKLLLLTDADEAFIASRTTRESREFEAYQLFALDKSDDPEPERVLHGYDLPSATLPALYCQGTCLILT